MNTSGKTLITVQTMVNAPIQKVWDVWTNPHHITQWNNASDDWHTPKAENDLRVGGKFLTRMEAKDGSFGFDFEGEYSKVEEHQLIEYFMSDKRNVEITFEEKGGVTQVTEKFEAEETNPIDMQQFGWQSILNNFKKYTESLSQKVRLVFEVEINASIERVYKTMLAQETYKQWTKEFNPTSSYKGSWEKGSKILFLGVDENGQEGGMVSRIKENILNSFVSIEHIGMLINGQEITTGPEVEIWAGSEENYRFTTKNGKTIVEVELDTNNEYKSYFEDTYPKALNVLKNICEE